MDALNVVICGLSITSSWGNGHATTFRSLVRALSERGHRVVFLERDRPWYADHRDLPDPPYCETHLYESLDELREVHRKAVREADLVIVGSYVPEGRDVCAWVLECARGIRAFYDIDTPVTVEQLDQQVCEYLDPGLAAGFDLYLTFTGGPLLRRLERRLGVRMARPLYCSADPRDYHPLQTEPHFDLGYMGTYCPLRQRAVDELFLGPAQRWFGGRFVLAGSGYPDDLVLPGTVVHREHVPPEEHVDFYSSQRFTLNATRPAMVRMGYSPSIRLFEAAASGTAIISDDWDGLSTFFTPGEEILVARSTREVLRILRFTPEGMRREMRHRARQRVLAEHTPQVRAEALEGYVDEVVAGRRTPTRVRAAGD